MEKICIVKRRQRMNQDLGVDISKQDLNDFNFFENYDDILKDTAGGNNDIKRETVIKSDVISFKLPEEQSFKISSNSYMESLFKGKAKGFVADIQHTENGQIIFNLSFEKATSIKMLKSKQVCKMLQISKYYLAKLVTCNKIRSYKLGKLRRFSLDDIIDYLAKSEDVKNFSL